MNRYKEDYFLRLEKELKVLSESKRNEIINQLKGDYADMAPGELRKLPDPRQLAKEFLYETPLSPASPWIRLCAALVDAFLIMLLITVIVFIPLIQINNYTLGLTITILGFAFSMSLLFLYFPILEGYKGFTLGKWIFGLMVVKEDGSSLDYGSAFLRRIPLWFGFFILDSITVFFFEKHQRAFDRVAKTLVIKVSNVKRKILITISILLICFLGLIPILGLNTDFSVFQESSEWIDSKIPPTPPTYLDVENIAEIELWDFVSNLDLEISKINYDTLNNGKVLTITFQGEGYIVTFKAYKGIYANDYIKSWSNSDNLKMMRVTNDINKVYSTKYRTANYWKQGWQRENWAFTIEAPRNFMSHDAFTDFSQWITLKFKSLK